MSRTSRAVVLGTLTGIRPLDADSKRGAPIKFSLSQVNAGLEAGVEIRWPIARPFLNVMKRAASCEKLRFLTDVSGRQR